MVPSFLNKGDDVAYLGRFQCLDCRHDLVNLLILFHTQNYGMLSKWARDSEFERLTVRDFGDGVEIRRDF